MMIIMMIIGAIGAFVIMFTLLLARPLAVIGFSEDHDIYNELITPRVNRRANSNLALGRTLDF